MRRRLAAGAAVLLVAGAGAGAMLLTSGDDPVTAAPRTEQQPTAEVARGTLRLSEEVAGELGYGPPTPVTGRGEGIVTWLPSAGVRVERGEQLVRVNDAPVALLYGDLPLYRTLQVPEKPKDPLLTGADVDLVATNLSALGYYGGSTEDATYGATLAGAVADWQEDRDLPGTGILTAADAVVAAGPVRVDEVLARVGSDAAGDLLTTTTTDRVLVLAVPPELARSLEPGRKVPVELADGTRVPTTVTDIGGRATTDEEGSGMPTVAVTVRPDRPGRLADAPLGPVRAEVVTARHRKATYVPVTALLALSGGGYAVERPDGTLTPVELGMVTEGRVEVTGIEPGESVVVAP